MPKELRTAFEGRLADIRNTAVADLKITNAEKIIAKTKSAFSTQMTSDAELEN